MRSHSHGLLQDEVAVHFALVQTTHLVRQRRLTSTYHPHLRRQLYGVEVVVLAETYYLDGKQRMALVFDGAYFSGQLYIPKTCEPYLHLRFAEIHFYPPLYFRWDSGIRISRVS